MPFRDCCKKEIISYPVTKRWPKLSATAPRGSSSQPGKEDPGFWRPKKAKDYFSIRYETLKFNNRCYNAVQPR